MTKKSTAHETDALYPTERFDALIIGAGFTGLYQLHSLRDRLGMKALVLEAADGVGGTWYWNRYPGARCDSESHSYCYYFSKELLEEWQWSERYPGQEEIRHYLNHVADRFDLRKDIRLSDRVISARFDDAATLWHVETESGKRYAAPFLITGVGCLSSANLPDIPGLKDFKGDWYHTGEWPHEGVDFRGKRVGQIGTGSTGIQAAPVIAETAEHLTVFQRTANYSIPARNAPLTDEFKRYLREHRNEIHETMVSTPNGHPFRIEERLTASVSEEERQAIYEEAWQKGGLRFRAVFKDMLVDKAANDTASDFIKAKIREIVKDPKTADLLSNLDHPFGTKRPPVDTDYFETFNRDNVTLVDIKSDPIKRITETGIETENGQCDLDIIVFATGFDAITGPLLRLNITGKNGLALKDAWVAGPKTYLGLQIAGFPNLFTVTGPGSPSVLTNMPVSIEQHVDWITDCIARMREEGKTRIEATEQAAEDWVMETNRAADATLLPLANSSWYLGANVPGKPRVFMPYAGGLQHYRARCDAVAEAGYEGFVLS
ncbi:flavin-containing monooxygenase [Nisaea sediminum]|uniref:flavin-containing monooxygenase n=1 Tax=Nisaea sediminum TaxID=2775867 RepID=UPI001866568C|nr:NAD(P)/FAD-dependent oxidoreductase [Nisaea sediminum]